MLLRMGNKRTGYAKPAESSTETLALFHPAVQKWFADSFPQATAPQQQAWPVIAQGASALVVAPTGTGKTLAAFLWCIHRLMFEAVPEKSKRCRILYISPVKALAVDVERNLRAPLVGIAHAAEQLGASYHVPQIMVRSGDTPAKERAQFLRNPTDILITTPESLYLLLTSQARHVLSSIDTVIIDEIHAVVPTKRGTHLALSLERLEALCGKPLQRIGLSATQRPLEEVARFLGGAQASKEVPKEAAKSQGEDLEQVFAQNETAVVYRPVVLVNAAARKPLQLEVRVPVEDMTQLGQLEELPSGPASQGPKRVSIWPSIYPKLLELIQTHRTTLMFVNSRRIAERLAGALNDLVGESLVRAHHGSLALPQRREIEDQLKQGQLRGLVATSSLELGIDMGSIDLVVQIESPPSVASGLQRMGRANHQVGAVSKGILFPKYRADLVACAAVTRAMHEGHIESVRYPRNPLDVLAQQIIALVSMDAWTVDDLFALVRKAAPYAHLQRSSFESVLDMLSGRYPSDEFAELRPRLTWDRVSGKLTPRQGAKKLAITNGGTIPDRGLYGVFLAAGAETKGSVRVGELDEEMVHESTVGETFVLGASTWRVEDITHDRVLVSPAPGEPGKTPFWKGDALGRPLEFGETIGATVRTLRTLPEAVARSQLMTQHGLDEKAAENLLAYLHDQEAATQVVPDDKHIVIERYRDELGDWRVCVLTPFGSRIHIPWCMAVVAQLRQRLEVDAETMWTDDGFVVRLPDTDQPPDTKDFLPDPQAVEELVMQQLGATSLFAARFRENAGRALLLPKRRPGQRSPLWQQRKRAADLLAVASRYASFPIILESYRECLRDVFDMPALVATLGKIKSRALRVHTVDSQVPSPFAGALLFSYVANFLYDGDAPLAERRAQTLAIDQSQLRELLGNWDLRDVLDATALEETEAQLQALDPAYHVHSSDGIHDLLLRLGDLSQEDLLMRCRSTLNVPSALQELMNARRVVSVSLQGRLRFIAVEDAARYRDALGIPLPIGLPQAFLAPVPNALLELVRRFARVHGPFEIESLTSHFGVATAKLMPLLQSLCESGLLLEGEFRPGGLHREYCDAEVLRQIRRKSLAKLRRQIAPAEPWALGRLVAHLQGVVQPRSGLDALLDVIQSLQGVPIAASVLERDVLPARVKYYNPRDLDTLMAAGEVVWVGVEPLGDRDGKVALYLSDSIHLLRPPSKPAPLDTGLEENQKSQILLQTLQTQGASFFHNLHEAAGGGYAFDTLHVLWDLVWQGLVTNDTFHVLREWVRANPTSRTRSTRKPPASSLGFRSRRQQTTPIGQGRWSLLPKSTQSLTTWSAAYSQQLLQRYGVLPREAMAAENVPGGFSALYPALKLLEESGRIRRGWFVAGLAATQFALPGAVDLLRDLGRPPESAEGVHLAATDPANPYGLFFKWPSLPDATAKARTFARTGGAYVVLVDGALAAYYKRNQTEMFVFLSDDEAAQTRIAKALATKLAEVGKELQKKEQGFSIQTIGGQPARLHPLAPFLQEAGFAPMGTGFHIPRERQVRSQARPGWKSYQFFQKVPLEEEPAALEEDLEEEHA